MRKGLFRKDAVEHQTRNVLGGLLMTPRPMHMIVTCVLAIWVLAVLVYLNTNQYTKKASVLGWLEPENGVFKLYSEPRRGKVKRLFVQDGDFVEKGTALIQIDYGQIDNKGQRIDEQFLRELSAKYDRITHSLSRLSTLHSNELASLKKSIARDRKVYEELQDIVVLARSQREMSKAHVETAQVLFDKGFTTEFDVENHQLQLLMAEQQLIRSQQELRNLEVAINNAQSQLVTLPEQHANERSSLENTLSDLRQNIISEQRKTLQTLYAPHDGLISGLQLKQGNTTNTEELLLSILPKHSTMLARIVVPVRSAGFVGKGQSLHIRYDAFPFQKFGLQHGTVVSVSHNLVLPGEVTNTLVAIWKVA
jgi:membrane fusion protein